MQREEKTTHLENGQLAKTKRKSSHLERQGWERKVQ